MTEDMKIMMVCKELEAAFLDWKEGVLTPFLPDAKYMCIDMHNVH
jgi:hypothetical protein